MSLCTKLGKPAGLVVILSVQMERWLSTLGDVGGILPTKTDQKTSTTACFGPPSLRLDQTKVSGRGHINDYTRRRGVSRCVIPTFQVNKQTTNGSEVITGPHLTDG